MRLYLECSMGASGDMLMAALYELLPDKEVFQKKMMRLGFAGVTFEYSQSIKCGIAGTHIAVRVSGAEEKSEDVSAYEMPKNPEDSRLQNTRGLKAKKHDPSQYKTMSASEPSHIHGNHTAEVPHILTDRTAEVSHKLSDQTAEVPHIHADQMTTQPHSHYVDGHRHNHSNPGADGHCHSHSNPGADGHRHSHSNPVDGSRRYGYQEILELISELDLPDNVLENALGVYRILGEAEATVHGLPLSSIHLHEVGAIDAVADIVGCCLLLNLLGITDISASPVHVGSGFVRCEHGILPVPVPATAEILRDIPIYGGQIAGELCTPTGAALLKHFVSSFGAMPPMTVIKIGYGMGTKDFEAANCLRAYLSEEEAPDSGRREAISEISCNLDDMTPEAIGAAFDILFENGALDVYATPIMMKKNRPAVMLSCLCAEDQRDKFARLILEHTSTLGVRISTHRRDVLNRTIETVQTKYGDIRVKCAHGYGAIKCKPEYDDVLAAAQQHSVPFTTVYDAARNAQICGG